MEKCKLQFSKHEPRITVGARFTKSDVELIREIASRHEVSISDVLRLAWEFFATEKALRHNED